MNRLQLLIMVIFIAFTLSACQQEDVAEAERLFGEIAGDDISGGDDIAPVEEHKFEEATAEVTFTLGDARSNAKDSITSGLVPALEKMIKHLDSVEDFIGNEDSSENSDNVMKAQKNAIHSLSKALGKISNRNDHDDDASSEGEEIQELVDTIFDSVLVIHDRQDNVVIYKIDKSVCNDDETDLPDPGCIDLIKDIRVIQKLASADAGLIALKYESFKPIALGYSPNEWFIQTNLAEIKGTVDAITSKLNLSADEQPPLPSTLKGVLRIGLKNIDADSSSAVFGVLEPVRVIQPGEVDLAIGKGKILDVHVNEATQKFTARIDAKAVDAMFHEDEEDDYGTPTGVTTKIAFAIAHVTGELVIDGSADTISVNGLNIGDNDFVVRANDEEMLRVSMKEINGVLTTGTEATDISEGTNDALSISSALDVKLTNSHVVGVNDDEFEAGETSNSFHVTAPASTEVELSEIEVIGDGSTIAETHGVIEVISGGPVNIIVTGDDAGTAELLEGFCYDMDAEDGPEEITCE